MFTGFYGRARTISGLMLTQQTQNICITFTQRRTNVEDVGPTLYKCNTNVLYLLAILFGIFPSPPLSPPPQAYPQFSSH